MTITREVALTEVYLDSQARLAGPSLPRVPARVWAAEIAKAVVWFVGLVLLMLGMALLAPTSRADSVPVSQVAAFLEGNSSLPLAVGVGGELAQNLLSAQVEEWGAVWQTGSLQASEDAVLRAIQLYVWPGGPTMITSEQAEPVVWAQSRVAIDTRLSVTLDPPVVDVGSARVPEGGTLVSVLVGLVGVGMVRWGLKRSMAERMRARLAAYRVEGVRA